MRDLVEANHLSYIWDHPCFYSVKSIHMLEKTDYYYTEIGNLVLSEPHYVMAKKPWTYIQFKQNDFRDSGWKIHISATVENHKVILHKVAEYAFANRIPFKFCTNYDSFIFINSNQVSRESSGKYIVLYPSLESFPETIETLYNILSEYTGPYILSDNAYKDSSVVYYRFGEINPVRWTDYYGTTTTRILNDKNEFAVDMRVPFFSLPEWVNDPFESHSQKRNSSYSKSILLSKYTINECIRFSTRGGIYKGTANDDGKAFVIKEARNNMGLNLIGIPGTEQLRKEYQMLCKVSTVDTCPKPIELIEDHGNVYIVEEHLEGFSLHSYPHTYSPYVYRDRDKTKLEANVHYASTELWNILISSLEGLKKIHSLGILLYDISPGNIIYNRDTKQVKFIDLESSRFIEEYQDNDPTLLRTPGFFCNETGRPWAQQELYKLGLVLMYCIMPYNAMFFISAEKVLDILHCYFHNTSISRRFLSAIYGLVTYKYHSAGEALSSILCLSDSVLPPIPLAQFQFPTLGKIGEIIQCHLHLYCKDQTLLACDPMGALTNQYCIAFGITGMMYALSRSNFENDNTTSNALVRKLMYVFHSNPHAFAPGLYVGTSGIAYALLECGYDSEAQQLLDVAIGCKLPLADYAYGKAGRMATLLAFYDKFNQRKYLDYAVRDAEELIDSIQHLGNHICWTDTEGDIYSGLTRGCAGIALSFLQLYLVTKNNRYLRYGIDALDSDLSRLERDSSGFLELDREPIGVSSVRVFSPYIHSGSAGLGCVLIRYYLVTKNTNYLSLIYEIIETCSMPMILYTGYLRGAVGLLTFYQDCRDLLGIETVQHMIDNLIYLIGMHYIDRGQYSGFLGDESYKISHDLFTGTAGVLLALDRNNRKKYCNPFIVFDNVFIQGNERNPSFEGS